jgi:hypothetical protein
MLVDLGAPCSAGQDFAIVPLDHRLIAAEHGEMLV